MVPQHSVLTCRLHWTQSLRALQGALHRSSRTQPGFVCYRHSGRHSTKPQHQFHTALCFPAENAGAGKWLAQNHGGPLPPQLGGPQARVCPRVQQVRSQQALLHEAPCVALEQWMRCAVLHCAGFDVEQHVSIWSSAFCTAIHKLQETCSRPHCVSCDGLC